MSSVTDKSLLSAELQGEEEEEFHRLLLQAAQNIQSSVPSPAESKPIHPLPGFCLKTHTSSGEKIFVNVCRSPHIPSPPDLTNEELACLIESENASTFRIPMSLGEPHVEVDKSFTEMLLEVTENDNTPESLVLSELGGLLADISLPDSVGGNGCTAYEVTINSNFFNKMESNQFLKEFFLTIAMEGLTEKYKVDISNQEWRILKNRKFMGSISEQNIRTKSKPIIQEMHTSSATAPEFTIVAEPSTSHPDRLVAKICLPEMISVRHLDLDLGEDRIVLRGHPELYHLDIFIPYSIVPEESRAQFQKETKILTVMMPVQRPLLLP